MSELKNPSYRQIFDAMRLLTPVETVFEKRRIGSAHDGGYVVLDTELAGRHLLSCGVGQNCDFELAFAELGGTVAMFDHSVAGPPIEHPGFRFFGTKVSGSASLREITLDGCLSVSDFPSQSGLILKVDIEGDEYSAFSVASDSFLSSFDQVVVEFHGLAALGERTFFDRWVAAISRITDRFHVVHVHANNHSVITLAGGVLVSGYGIFGGLIVADVLEVTFLRKDLSTAKPNKSIYPTRHDSPNNPSVPDHMLVFPPFMPVGRDLKEVSELLRESEN